MTSEVGRHLCTVHRVMDRHDVVNESRWVKVDGLQGGLRKREEKTRGNQHILCRVVKKPG